MVGITVMTIKQGKEKTVTHEDRERHKMVLLPFPQTVVPKEPVSAGWSSNQPPQWDYYISWHQ